MKKSHHFKVQNGIATYHFERKNVIATELMQKLLNKELNFTVWVGIFFSFDDTQVSVSLKVEIKTK
jgi:hypothetical protein